MTTNGDIKDGTVNIRDIVEDPLVAVGEAKVLDAFPASSVAEHLLNVIVG